MQAKRRKFILALAAAICLAGFAWQCFDQDHFLQQKYTSEQTMLLFL
jgi:hypothetical protein